MISEALRSAAARERLLHQLGDIAGLAASSALARCPYRDRADRCGFSHGCRNQRRTGGVVRCAGGTLDSRRAGEQEE